MKFLRLMFLATCLYWLPQTIWAADNAKHTGFVLTDSAGKTHALSDYKGKWVFVNYWATWCPPCLEEIPDLVSFSDDNKNVKVIGVVFDYPNKAAVTKYVDDMLMSYPIVYGDDGVEKQIGSAQVLPTTYIYNPRGELFKVKRGIVTKQYLNSLIKQ